MPHSSFSHPDVVALKLDTGYNIGMIVDDGTELLLIQKRKKPVAKINETTPDHCKPKVTLRGTGGTIASYVDYDTGAVHPASTSEELSQVVPNIFDLCNMTSRVVFQKLSENIGPEDWVTIAQAAATALNNKSAGVIIAHGTDTMGYTAAALLFMLKNLTGPVVLVGSQRSSDRPSSDARRNLTAATRVALTDLGKVVAVMHGTSSPEYCTIHCGTKVRKMHTSRRDAFQSINAPSLGYVNDTVKFTVAYPGICSGETCVYPDLDTNVSLIYYHPGLDTEQFSLQTEDADGVVIVGTGLGHVNQQLIPTIKELTDKQIPVVMTTQCLWGRVNMHIYSVGRKLIQANVISGVDRLPETALIKLMWVLANCDDIPVAMQTNYTGEITDRTLFSTYS